MTFLRSIGKSLRTVTVVAIVLIAALVFNHFVLHIRPFRSTVKTAIAQAAPSEITRIEPIVLDCRAYIDATVPVKGKKSYQVSIHLGPFHAAKNYRTDTVKITAVGDVEACVKDGALIDELKNGGWKVTVPGKSIEFDRPRVDVIATAKSVHYKKGWVGKFTDEFPWVGEDNSLTMSGLSFAQSVIGGSSCMRAAWDTTQKAIVAAYQQQAIAKHLDPKKVSVVFSGPPNFNQHAKELRSDDFHGVTFQTDANGVKCDVRKDALKLTP